MKEEEEEEEEGEEEEEEEEFIWHLTIRVKLYKKNLNIACSKNFRCSFMKLSVW